MRFQAMNSRISRKTQKQMFLLVSGGHICALQRHTQTWRLHTLQGFINLGKTVVKRFSE